MGRHKKDLLDDIADEPVFLDAIEKEQEEIIPDKIFSESPLLKKQYDELVKKLGWDSPGFVITEELKRATVAAIIKDHEE